MNKLFIALALALTAPLFTVEGPELNKRPFTQEEQKLFTEIKELRGQLKEKHEALIALLEKDHPKLAAHLRQAISEARKNFEEKRENFQERRQERRQEHRESAEGK